jgi:hypothetical protein
LPVFPDRIRRILEGMPPPSSMIKVGARQAVQSGIYS